MKQTAVEWLVDYLNNIKELPFIRQNLNINEQNILNDIIQQAKEMEKEQMIKFADEYECECTHPYKGRVMSVEQYYNETFKSE